VCEGFKQIVLATYSQYRQGKNVEEDFFFFDEEWSSEKILRILAVFETQAPAPPDSFAKYSGKKWNCTARISLIPLQVRVTEPAYKRDHP